MEMMKVFPRSFYITQRVVSFFETQRKQTELKTTALLMSKMEETSRLGLQTPTVVAVDPPDVGFLRPSFQSLGTQLTLQRLETNDKERKYT